MTGDASRLARYCHATLRSRVIWIVLVIGVVLIWTVSTQFQAGDDSVSFSEFVQWVDAGQVESVILTGNKITGSSRSGDRFRTYAPPQYDGLVNTLVERDVAVTARNAASSPWVPSGQRWDLRRHHCTPPCRRGGGRGGLSGAGAAVERQPEARRGAAAAAWRIAGGAVP